MRKKNLAILTTVPTDDELNTVNPSNPNELQLLCIMTEIALSTSDVKEGTVGMLFKNGGAFLHVSDKDTSLTGFGPLNIPNECGPGYFNQELGEWISTPDVKYL